MRKQLRELRTGTRSRYLSAVSDIVRSEYENYLPQSRHTSYVCPEIVKRAAGIEMPATEGDIQEPHCRVYQSFPLVCSHDHTGRNVSDGRVMIPFVCAPQHRPAQNGLHP